MTHNAFASLAERTRAGNLRILSVLAPARSSSTALERALLESPSIDLQINDPWAIYDEKGREEKTYEYIAARISEYENKTGAKMVTVLIKNVADYIPPGDAWDRWCEIANHHVFLIRNPLLAMHSLFRMLGLHLKSGDVLVSLLTMDQYAQEKGFSDWNALQGHLSGADDFALFDDLYRAYFMRDQKIHKEPEMLFPVLAHAGYQVAKDKIPSDLDKIVERVFAYRITGWEALFQHAQAAFKAMPERISVVDSTLLRMQPGKVMQALSADMGIDYTDMFQAWSDRTAKKFTTDYDGAVPYYDRVLRSRGIEAPTETPPALKNFPYHFQRHLTGKDGAFEIYAALFKRLPPGLLKDVSLDHAFSDIDPVFIFAFLTLFPDLEKDTGVSAAEIKKYHPDFLDVFRTIENAQATLF